MEVKSNNIKNSRGVNISTVFISLFIIVPLFALLLSVFKVDFDNFYYLWNNLLVDYSLNTIYLVLLTSFFSLIFGIFPAWFISTSKFKGRNLYDIILYLPLAIPTYIMAFTYSDVLSYTGPIQSFARKYIPEISNILNQDYLQIEVLAIIMGLALYPYIYTACRISFSLIGSNYVDLCRNLGMSQMKAFFRVILPISRVAIFSGLFLVIMEVLNEYGAVKYFGVNTFTSGIFRSWYSMQDVDTASLLAVSLFIIVVIFFFLERFTSSKYQFNYSVNTKQKSNFSLTNSKRLLVHLVCLTPIVFGFIIPILFIISNVISEFSRINFSKLIDLIFNTLSVSIVSALIIVVIAVLFQFFRKISKTRIVMFFSDLISLTYALPGAVIGLSLILLVTSFPNLINSNIFIGSFFLLVYAYSIRHMAVGISPLKTSFEKHPRSYDDTGMNLGLTPFKLFNKIHLPINKSAIIIAFLLCFIDIMKELPITLILRPFNFDTLAVQTYQYAIEEMIPKSGVYSLSIVMIGSILLIFLKNVVNKQID